LALLKTNVITTVLSANFGDKIGVFLEKQNNTMITIVLLKIPSTNLRQNSHFSQIFFGELLFKKGP
jgi:hypothetical protein